MQQLRIGIVGCGEVAQTLHLPSLYQLPEQFCVTALCDVSQQVVNGVGDHWQVAKRYLDYQALLEQSDVDVVLVANPNAYHAEVALAAITAGKHVLIEKPMCINLREADEIIAAQAKAGVTVQVGYMRRYAPAFLEACALVRQMKSIRQARVHALLGNNALFSQNTMRLIRGNDVSQEIVAAGNQRQAELTREAIGDVADPELNFVYFLLLGLSTHDLSAMRELIGVPKRVLYAAKRHGGLAVSAAFDYGDFICHFESDINNIAKFDVGLTVTSANQIVHVQYDTPYVRNLPVRLFVTEANDKGGVHERAIHPTWGDAFVAEWQAFYANVTEQRTPKTSPADFRHDLELFHEMIRLMQTA
ncbi:MAG: Gfo/Idh/MocA family oxidoreductase [Caldilineaceae bacterium]